MVTRCCRSALIVILCLAFWGMAQRPVFGQPSAGQLVHPTWIATDRSGNIYVGEPEKHRLQKFSSSGTLPAQWGTFGAAAGQFNQPQGIAIDSQGNVYVADAGNFRVQKFNAAGVFQSAWGKRGSGNGEFLSLSGVAVDNTGAVYVTDSVQKRVQVFSGQGVFLRSWGGITGQGDGQFSPFQGPHGIAIDASRNVYVADTGNHRIQRFTSNGVFTGWLGGCTSGTRCIPPPRLHSEAFDCRAATCSSAAAGTGEGQFSLPFGLTFDGNDNLFVVDTFNNRVQKFDRTGRFLLQWGVRGSGDGQFKAPLGISADSLGRLYVADTGNHRVQSFTNSGALIALWGADILIRATPGEAPALLQPLFVRPGQSVTVTVDITSVNRYAGPVDLSATCCLDFATGLGAPPIGVNVRITPAQVMLAANGAARAWLTISANSAPVFRKAITSVGAVLPTAGVQRGVSVVFTAFAPETQPPCPRFTQASAQTPLLLPTSVLIEAVAKAKAKNPTQTRFALAIYNPVGGKIADAWGMTIEEAPTPTIPANEARIVLDVSQLDWAKMIVAINSAACNAPLRSLRVEGRQTGQFTIRQADTTTIVLRKPVCTAWFLWCWNIEWRDVAVWSEPGFWAAFGGKQVTIRWLKDTPD